MHHRVFENEEEWENAVGFLHGNSTPLEGTQIFLVGPLNEVLATLVSCEFVGNGRGRLFEVLLLLLAFCFSFDCIDKNLTIGYKIASWMVKKCISAAVHRDSKKESEKIHQIIIPEKQYKHMLESFYSPVGSSFNLSKNTTNFSLVGFRNKSPRLA